MDIAANPSSIGILDTSAVTSDFNQSSDGAAVSGFPDGVVIGFTATNGTMIPPAAPTTGGAATSTFDPAAPGTATVSATLDEETVSTDIQVVVAAAIPALS